MDRMDSQRPWLSGVPQFRQERTDVRKTHKAALVIIPPRDVWEPIQAIRRAHDRKVGRWMPHINLLFPFRPRRHFGAAARLAGETCAELRPFEVTLGAFGSFDHGSSHTMWLDPTPQEPIIELQKRLLEKFPDCDEVSQFQTGYRPHLSIGQAQTQEDVDRLVAEFAAAWTPITFTVGGVALIWRSRQTKDVFKVDRKVRLGDAAEERPPSESGSPAP